MAKKDVEEILEKTAKRFIHVSKGLFYLRLYERDEDTFEFACFEYEIAFGTRDYRTPKGLFVVQEKAKDPDWMMPDSEWIPEDLRGTIVPGGDPANPIRERWLGILPDEGIGIHGTLVEDSLGSRASHGCIRMLPRDVIDLYDRTPLGTLVLIGE
jgi:lipoprotein-anchoring transpeptidase ErfK/SrfK